MKELLYIKRFRIYIWAAAAFFMVWFFSDLHSYADQIELRTLDNLWRVLYVLFFNYIFFEYTMPRISKKNILRSILLILGHIFFYSGGLYIWREIGIQLHIYTIFTSFKDSAHAAEAQFSYSLSSVIFFALIRHIYIYIRLKQSAQRLRIEKQEAELNYLKSQTNPHFLFNTLNNIYSLARDKSDLAPESIMRLSKILRFMLYETSGAFISIEQEMKIITDYIELEKLRYDESLRINFNHNIEDMKQAVPPLLLIPLVENAFKHGVSETRGKPYIDIHLSVNQRKLTFVVKNSSEGNTGEEDVKENIGLSNLRRQLELLYSDYDLAVKQVQSAFTATLYINLASHV